MRRLTVLVALLFLGSTGVLRPARAQIGGDYRILAFAIQGGARVDGGPYVVRGVLGAPDPPDVAGGEYSLAGGYSFAPLDRVVGVGPRDTRFSFLGPMPNPAGGEVRFRLVLPDGGRRVEVTIHSLDGRRVRTLAAGPLPSGAHDLHWNAQDDARRRVAAGVYFVRVKTDDTLLRRRVVLLHD